jgi:hypothetical protein
MKMFRASGSVIIVLLTQALFSVVAMSQQALSRYPSDFSNAEQLMQDVSGKPIFMKVNYNVEGSPFYPEEYYLAIVFVKNGKKYNDVRVKFNLQENLLLFKLPDGTEMSAVTPVNKIIFTDTSEGGMMLNRVFENGFASIDKQNEQTYYEVLDSGKVKLLKCYSVSYDDRKYYAQASITRVFLQKEKYYIRLMDGTMRKIGKGAAALLSLFTDKKNELQKFISEKNLKCRKENDWRKVIAYYNSLFTGA